MSVRCRAIPTRSGSSAAWATRWCPGWRRADIRCPARGLSSQFRRAADGVDDALITGAAAQVAGQPLADLFISRVGVVLQQRRDRGDEARCAEPALESMTLPQCGLHG